MEEKKKEINWPEIRKWAFVFGFFTMLIFVLVKLGIIGTIGFFLFFSGAVLVLINFKGAGLRRFALFSGIISFVLGGLFLVFSWAWVFLFLPLIVGWFLLIAYWYLAPKNRWFTIVKEGTSKIVVRGNKFQKALLTYTGYYLDKEWNIKEGQLNFLERLREGNLFGGLYLYSFFHPLDDIYIYNFKWANLNEKGEMQEHEKILDYILVSDYAYALKAERLEDKNGAHLDLILVITIRIINPYKPLFRIQTKWLATILNRIIDPIASIVSSQDLSYWMEKRKELTEKINEILPKENEVFQFIKEEYGVEIKRIEVKEVIPEEKIREIILTPFAAKKKAEGVVVEAEGERKKLEEIGAGQAFSLEAKIKALQTAYPTIKELLSDFLELIEKVRGKKEFDAISILRELDMEKINKLIEGWKKIPEEQRKEIIDFLRDIRGS